MLSKTIFFIALVGFAAAETEYKSCTTETDCEGANPYCALTYTDNTEGEDAAPKYVGVCVQCRDDCDCGVNQYCATDAPLTAASFKASDDKKNGNDKYYAFGFEKAGFAFPSVCRAYGQSNSERANAGLGKNGASALNGECSTSDEDSVNVHINAFNKEDCENTLQTGWTKKDFRAQDHGTGKCGALASQYAADGYAMGWIGSGEKGSAPRVAIEGDAAKDETTQTCADQQKAALVFPAVDEDKTNKVAGSSTTGNAIVMTKNGITGGSKGKVQFTAGQASYGDIQVKLYDWEGVCFNRKCVVCTEGSERCTLAGGNSRGTPQICVGGSWIAKTGGPATGGPWVTKDSAIVSGNSTNTFLLALVIFTAFGAIIFCCCGCMRAYQQKKSAEAAGEKVTYKTFIMKPVASGNRA